MSILSILFVTLGAFILFVSAVGTIRLPDFYSRANALGIIDTVGTSLLLTGIAFHSGLNLSSIKLIMIVVFIQIANPAITHILTRAAMRSGLKPIQNSQEGKKK